MSQKAQRARQTGHRKLTTRAARPGLRCKGTGLRFIHRLLGEAAVSDFALDQEAMTLFSALLDVPELERAAWLDAQTAGRPDLRTRVTALAEADRSNLVRTGGAIGALRDETVPERIGAYRIVALIGHGGMGSVYRAERDAGDFERTVAIKVIKPGLFTPEVVRRFQSERQTLATLTHPNIAALYDGGETEAGAPYLVMEYVDGAPLLEWVDATKPTRAQRLRLFADICAAVAFAHSRLIVHRDLSPSNVLVTRDGVAKLIDFGIAKPADVSADPADATTAQMTVTPGYTAPERLITRQVTTSADVFSLGKLLRDLSAPHRRDRELRAIVDRACAEDPRERYPSVDALAADLSALTGRRPVAAYSNRRGYALRKFVGRHPLVLASSLAAFALLATALVLTLNANVRAEQARLEAEARFEETRAIAKTMLFDVFDEVSTMVGSTRARETLARTGLAYLEALAADEDAPTELRVEAGLGFLRLSQVVGGGQAGELGRYEDANALLAEAERIIGPLYEAHPDNPLVARAMASLLLERSGAALYNDSDVPNARALAVRARDILRPIATTDADAARQYAVALRAEGDTYGWDDQYAEARDRHVQAETFIAGLPPTLRNDVQVMRARSANLRLLGESYHRLGEAEQARVILDRAVEINRAVLATAPQNPTFIRNLSISLWYRAVVHRTNERNVEARESIQEAVELGRTLRARDPNDAGAIRMLAIASEVYAQVLGDLRQYPQSFAMGAEVIAAHRDLVRRAEGAVGARRSLAAALMTYGGNFYNGGEYARACSAWAEGLSIYRDMERAGVLSDADRARALAQAIELTTRACNPPRAGMGPRI